MDRLTKLLVQERKLDENAAYDYIHNYMAFYECSSAIICSEADITFFFEE